MKNIRGCEGFINTDNRREIDDVIEEGRATLGMVRPLLMEDVLPEWSDASDLQGLIIDAVHSEEFHKKTGLAVVRLATYRFTGESVRDFYGDAVSRQEQFPPERSGRGYAHRAEEFMDIMTRDASQVMILNSNSTDAIEEWRGRLGHWDVEKQRMLGERTLRSVFASSNANNVLHGSGSAEDAHKEVEVVSRGMGHI